MKIQHLFLIINMIFWTHNIHAANDDYPRTIEEERRDEMGSITGEDGITFRPTKIKNETTATTSKEANKYLWQAAIEIVNFAPLASTDDVSGVIITDWYNVKNRPGHEMKINVFIKDNIISTNAIEVKIFERVIKSGNIVQNQEQDKLASTLEAKILQKARLLYVNAQKK